MKNKRNDELSYGGTTINDTSDKEYIEKLEQINKLEEECKDLLETRQKRLREISQQIEKKTKEETKTYEKDIQKLYSKVCQQLQCGFKIEVIEDGEIIHTRQEKGVDKIDETMDFLEKAYPECYIQISKNNDWNEPYNT